MRMDYLAQPKHRKMDNTFGTWNVKSLHRSGSLKTVAMELGKHKLHLGVYRRSDGTRAALNGQRIIHFSVERGMKIIS
jgi:hypothetical protein